MRYRFITCLRCGEEAERISQSHSGVCGPCDRLRDVERRRAHALIAKQIRAGALKRATEHVCVDCGTRARDWEHRDYTKPHDVVPVCRPCNLKRPAAFDSVYRPHPTNALPQRPTANNAAHEGAQ